VHVRCCRRYRTCVRNAAHSSGQRRNPTLHLLRLIHALIRWSPHKIMWALGATIAIPARCPAMSGEGEFWSLIPWLGFDMVITGTFTLPDLAPYANTATLRGQNLRCFCALVQTRKLLGTEDLEGLRDDFHAVGHGLVWKRSSGRAVVDEFPTAVGIERVLNLLEKRELETVPALVSHTEIWENEIGRLRWLIKISGTRNADAAQNRQVGRDGGHFAVGNGASGFK
jgi:hypothetical protein